MNRRVMMRCALVGLVAGSMPVAAQPRNPVASNKWQVDLEFVDPQRVSISIPGEAQPVTYWYVVYQVTNATGRDVEFFPSFRLVTDTLEVVEGGVDVNPRVFEAIAARHRQDFPFLLPPHKASGLLLQGKENARASCVVFRDFDGQASAFTLFVSGLSNETDRVPNPTFMPDEPESRENPRSYVLRKTLSVRYDFPGDPQTRQSASPVRRDRVWVLR